VAHSLLKAMLIIRALYIWWELVDSLSQRRRAWSFRLDTLAAVSGSGAPNKKLLQQLMDADFDPAAWDHHMESAFGEAYYAEAEREADIIADRDEVTREVEEWAGTGEEADDETFAALHKRVTGCNPSDLPENDYDMRPMDEVEGEEEGGGLADDAIADSRSMVSYPCDFCSNSRCDPATEIWRYNAPCLVCHDGIIAVSCLIACITLPSFQALTIVQFVAQLCLGKRSCQ
jgi:hypothetical protein